MMAARGDRGVSRVLDKLEASVNSGHYYEAHQMYRTLYFRYLSQKKYADLLNLLYKGSTLLLQRDQQESGADLAILLIDVLNKSVTKPCHEWIDKIARLFELMSASIPERESFLTNAVKWSMDNNKKGHPFLHQVNSLLTVVSSCIIIETMKLRDQLVQPGFRLAKVDSSFIGFCLKCYNKIPPHILQLNETKYKSCIKRTLCSQAYYKLGDYIADKKAWLNAGPAPQGCLN